MSETVLSSKCEMPIVITFDCGSVLLSDPALSTSKSQYVTRSWNDNLRWLSWLTLIERGLYTTNL